jgi:hypothetical protein
LSGTDSNFGAKKLVADLLDLSGNDLAPKKPVLFQLMLKMNE